MNLDIAYCVNKTCPMRDLCERGQDTGDAIVWASEFEYATFRTEPDKLLVVTCDNLLRIE